MTTEAGQKDKKPKKITIEVDDEKFEVEERSMTVSELLALIDLDPAESYLVELHGHHGGQKKYEGADEEIKLHNGIRFVSADRAPAEVA
ncbi:MAG: multiubiquitin domain-containing protein [Solirubrobacterales bacterium]